MSVITLEYPGKVAVQQRVLPTYRVPFFDMFARHCAGGLSVFAGQPLAGENIKSGVDLEVARYYPAINNHFRSPDSPFYRCNQPNILAWLSEWCPDVLIIEANTRYPSLRHAIQWMHQRKRPVIGWGLGAPPSSGLLGAMKTRRRVNLIRSLDGVIAYSNKGRDEYRALGMPAERVSVAVNAASPRPTQPPPGRVRSPGEPGAVVFIGRLQERKKIDNLLWACSQLAGPLQPDLWIIGDGPAAQDFKLLAAQVYPSAIFPGAKHGEELEAYLTKADLFVLPGTGGLAVQQAMAFGLPIIVAQGDGTQADLVTPDNGWLIPDNDIDALRNALEEALSHPERLIRMGNASYQLVRDEINLEAMVGVFLRAVSGTTIRSQYP